MAEQNNFESIRQALEARFSQATSGPSDRQRPRSFAEQPSPPRQEDQERRSRRPQSEFFTDMDVRTNRSTPSPSHAGRGRQEQTESRNEENYIQMGIKRPPRPPKPSANSAPVYPPRSTQERDGSAPRRRRQFPQSGSLSPSPRGTATSGTPTSREPVAEDINSMSWYHGNITKEAGIEILSSNIYPKGSFLVRDSSVQGNYVIMQKTDIRDPPDIINIRITSSTSPRGNRVYSRESNRVFPTMAELVDYYSANLSQQSEYCILSTPVGRVDRLSHQAAAIRINNSSGSESSSQESSDTDEMTEDDLQSRSVAATTLIAICDCVASHPSILSFKTNDVITIQEHSDGEWSLAKNVNTGQEGYILAKDESLFVQRPI
ncbi:hypothetical protein HOLleu_40423 [Holothuria leucospilota]|uniref:SH3 domain-containing protein n=1 Tax=Holothuria leucospilota TaxID=206669 RepID=A0A9Q0YG25_HOLLE|nr:hypothetical protein HOLleu_40423 [Holothuria leucospilota]